MLASEGSRGVGLWLRECREDEGRAWVLCGEQLELKGVRSAAQRRSRGSKDDEARATGEETPPCEVAGERPCDFQGEEERGGVCSV